MAHRLQLAHSETAHGVGVMNAEPWFDWADVSCVQDPTSPYCHNAFLADVNLYLLDVEARAGQIDDLANLIDASVYIVAGYEAPHASRDYQGAIAGMYSTNGTPDDQMFTEEGTPGAIDAGKGGEVLEWLLGNQGHGPFLPSSCGAHEHGVRFRFPQAPFTQDGSTDSIGLAEYGWAYVPDDCYRLQCHVHFAVHGDLDAFDIDGSHMGYDAWAARNLAIIIEPKATSVWDHEFADGDRWVTSRDADHPYHAFMGELGDHLTSCGPRSWDLDTPATVTFVNESDGEAEMWWYDNEGDTVWFGTIYPGESDTFTTFAGAPWGATDYMGNSILVGGGDVWSPETGGDHTVTIG